MEVARLPDMPPNTNGRIVSNKELGYLGKEEEDKTRDIEKE